MVICSRHFQPQDFFLPAYRFPYTTRFSGGTSLRRFSCTRRRLKRTAVPSQNLPEPINAEETTEAEVHLIDQEHEAYVYTENEEEEAQILACMSASPVVLLKRLTELPPETSKAALFSS
ncbi:hypothetical protein MTO96_015826 [Rhipicephalus appendiculatus]